MKMPVKFRGRALAPMLAVLATLGAGLLGPATAGAVRDASYSEGHQLRVEERLARRAQHQSEREARRAEREGRRNERAQRRAAKKLGRQEPREEREAGAGEAKAPQASPQTNGCQVTIAAGPGRVLAGESAVLSGSVSCPAEAGPSSGPVQIYELTKGSRPRVAALVKTLTASGDGSFETSSAPLDANTVFDARVGAAEASVTVRVAPAVTIAAGAASETGTSAGTAARTRRTTTTFSGTVTPAAAGMLVALQASSPTEQRWHTLGWTHTDAAGAYSILHYLHSPGTTRIRTLVHPGAHLTVGASETLSLRGVQPQRTGLTVETSADPVVEGQPVQISGVAAGAPGVTVKLLGLTAGGTWTVLGQTTTDEAGGYSFEETPLETTIYRVADATASSKILKQRVAFAISPAETPSTATAGQPVTFAGTVAHAPAGTQVELEALGVQGVGFHPLAGGVVGSAEDYSISRAFAVGAYTLRIRVIGNWTLNSAAGEPFVLTVSP